MTAAPTAARTTPRSLWLALLMTHLLGLAALVGWVLWQGQPVAMHDLQLGSGEKLKCVSYAPFHRPGQTPLDERSHISRAQIADDLAALAKITDCVRLYSVGQGLDQVPELARAVGIKVMVGAWIGYDVDRNAAELERALAVTNANADVVSALIVGNEVLLRRERTVDEIQALIEHAQANTEVPVTYADVWEFWVRNDRLAKSVDFVTVHILPFWEDDPVDIDHAVEHVSAIHAEVSAHFTDRAILIGETGWPSAGRQREESKPSRVNQARYIREFIHEAHARGWNYNLIEAIDQPWKRKLEGTVGGHWGMLEAGTLRAKFPLAGPVAERADVVPPLLGALLGGAIALGLALASGCAGASALRTAALSLTGATSGLIAVLHLEHAHLAYRDLGEWLVMGTVAVAVVLAAAALACWQGGRIPAAALAWRTLRQHPASPAPADVLGAVRGLLLFAAAVAALLLLVDARYRDFPVLLYLAPAAIFGVIGCWQRSAGRVERICATVIVMAVIGRWLPEPANPQAIGWLLVGLLFAVPVLLPRTGEHEQS